MTDISGVVFQKLKSINFISNFLFNVSTSVKVSEPEDRIHFKAVVEEKIIKSPVFWIQPRFRELANYFFHNF